MMSIQQKIKLSFVLPKSESQIKVMASLELSWNKSCDMALLKCGMFPETVNVVIFSFKEVRKNILS